MNRFKHIALFCITLSVLFSCGGTNEQTEEDNQEPEAPLLGFYPEEYGRTEGIVKNGETFSGLLGRLGMSQAEAYSLVQVCDTVFDVRKLRAGNSWEAYTDTTANRLEYLVYTMDRLHSAVFHCADSMSVNIVEKATEHIRDYADVTIESSLWVDMTKAGAPADLIIKLSDVFAWTVDFFGLQKEDKFRVIYDRLECEGETIGVDTVYLALFKRDTTDIYAIMYDQNDGGNIYWDEKGGSMRRTFLKAPLEFKRISSGFSYSRKHPVTGEVKAHTAVDYAAPTGTPVVSIGDGTVISVGWAGGGGNTVKIRHNSVYTTSYMHLSKYGPGIKNGTRVSQGQVIGYVGMTGTATGPHLDFRVYMNGTPINPLTMDSPAAEPIKEENKAALDSVFTAYKAEMEKVWK